MPAAPSRCVAFDCLSMEPGIAIRRPRFDSQAASTSPCRDSEWRPTGPHQGCGASRRLTIIALQWNSLAQGASGGELFRKARGGGAHY
eukprot:CAMPEP_0176121348 /NCGR_PEP_ID=MMETSP0120_2-20121206/61076_1 /TAXON_ID=160619 /ORGANISM="Kryptoperidinium foliaceum, Strain CCMP 1326" /LENGTH=87 /DNA_ID=CAMNT_0017455885 /DNA_START=68 /DNA_END=329 /DNA_ORIENTATION=-